MKDARASSFATLAPLLRVYALGGALVGPTCNAPQPHQPHSVRRRCAYCARPAFRPPSHAPASSRPTRPRAGGAAPDARARAANMSADVSVRFHDGPCASVAPVDKGANNRDKGTNNRDKGTNNRDKGTNNRDNGMNNRF
jgi:hypothetical protein